MNPLFEVTDIMARLRKPTPPAVRAQLELRIKELESEYVRQSMDGADQEERPAM